MAGETPITAIGNLTSDPELRYSQSGVPVANFTIASTPRTFDRQSGEWKDGDALFLRCSLWREHAENVAASLGKGMRVIVQGNLRQRNYENREGERRTSIELDVQEIGPALRYATAQVTRTISQGGGKRSAAEEPWQTPGGTASQAQDAWATPGVNDGPAMFQDNDTPF